MKARVGERRRAGAVDRRRFMHTIGAAGAAGAFAAIRRESISAQTPGRTGAASGPEFVKPAGLRTGAQLDSRFPVSFAEPVTESLRVVMAYFTALSQRDAEGVARTLHFPFAIYETIEPIVVPTPADFVASPPPSLNGTGKGKSRILKGSYDLLESINVHLYCPVGAGPVAVVHTLHARWPQAAGVRRHLFGDE
jgi:hypothetical protein